MDRSAAQSASNDRNRPLLARVRVLPTKLYSYIWRTSRRRQLRLCVLTGILAPLGIVPLELQRRIVDTAINTARIDSLLILGGVYFAVVLLYGGIKYLLNMEGGVVLEEVTLDLRQRMIDELHGAHPITYGTATSVVTAEAEEIGNFASDSFALPLLQGGTILWTVGYLIWVQPEVAALATLVYLPQIFLVPRLQGAINRLSRRRTVLQRTIGQNVIEIGTAEHRGPHSRHQHARVLASQIFRTRIRIYKLKYLLNFLSNFLHSLGPVLVLVVGGYLVIRGQTEVSTVVVFISGFNRISDPWAELVGFYRSVSHAHVVYDLVRSVLTVTG
jgi:ABC-type bacteriocin/lantibiotic exporter with double-glycine peptidase domain